MFSASSSHFGRARRGRSWNPVKRHLRLIAIFALLTSVFGCGSQSESGADPATLTLFVAASLTDVIQAVGDAYERDSSVHIVYNFASSGALAQQLLAAPRADLFLSASERWMDEVERGDRLLNGSRRTLLSNSLVVIANNGSDYEMEVARDLCELSFAFLATGDPDSVPAGRYARQWLESVGCPDGQGAWSKVDGRLSPTPDVRAALAQVEGSFDVIGIVYRTDYIARAARRPFDSRGCRGRRTSNSVSRGGSSTLRNGLRWRGIFSTS